MMIFEELTVVTGHTIMRAYKEINGVQILLGQLQRGARYFDRNMNT